MIRTAREDDFSALYDVINDAAVAYSTILPDECRHDPYMDAEELSAQIDDGVRFYCWSDDDALLGVMGFQDKGEVQLIRHAYVKTEAQGRGIGGTLLACLIKQAEKPLLVGTWKKAVWAIRFYEKYGFAQTGDEQSGILLQRYWNIPQWHAESSLVLKLG